MPRLKSYEFRREREGTWDELDRIVTQAEKRGLKSLTAADLTRLPVLYRATVSSLSVARAISTDRNVLDYLSSLSARAYIQVYGAKEGVHRTLSRFVTETFPRSVRAHRGHVLLAAAFVLAGVAAGFLLTAKEPDRFYSFVSAEMAQGRTPAATTETLREVLYDRPDESDALAAFASFLFTHNTQVGFLAFALGFLAGLPVFLLLFATGLMLGAFGALYGSRALGVDFWGWILPHGLTEILAVVLCGAAGLRLAQALLFPGRRARLDALARAGREAGVLVLGSVLLFFVAGLVEGIFRQTVTSVPTRYGVAVASAIAWLVYFLGAGRQPR